VVANGIWGKIHREYPSHEHLLKWDPSGLSASASYLGVSVTLQIFGTNPTNVTATADRSFLARLISESTIRGHISAFLDGLKQEIP